jgi:hypothetical protein
VRCATADVIHIRRVPPPPKPPPYFITDHQLAQICSASTWLCGSDRDQFWQLIAAELEQIPEPGEGAVARSIARAFLQLFRPPEIDPHTAPRTQWKVDHGANRYEAKLDAIEARRTRRERSDAR